MNTYILSVNTLTWNLTSERHDNCAPCLGLIFPIRRVTPPPNFWLEYFLLALHLQSLCILLVFNANMDSCLSLMYWFSFCPLQHSLIAMSSHWIFWTKWMWSDPNLSMLLSQVYLSKSYAFYWNCQNVFSASLLAKDTETNINLFSMLNPFCLKPREVGTTTRQSRRAWERGTTSNVLHDRHVSFRCEPPGAPV